MPSHDRDLYSLTEIVIGAAVEVHKDKGPELLESIYQWSLQCELTLQGIDFEAQRTVDVRYKVFHREDVLRFDFLVSGRVLVEVKAVDKILPIHQAQLFSYMKLLDVPVGLLINFNTTRVADGIVRLSLPGRSSD